MCHRLLTILCMAVACLSLPALGQIAVGGATQAVGTGALITYINSGSADSRNNCGSVSPSIPAGNNGDLLIAVVNARENSATLSASAGWTALVTPTTYPPDTSQELRIAIYYRIATGSDALTVTQSGTCSSLAARVARYRGVDPDEPFDGTPSVALTSQNSDNIDASGVTTTVADTMVVVAAVLADDKTVSAAAGWTEAFDSALDLDRDLGLSIHHQIQGTAGAVSANNWDQSGTGNVYNIAAIFALKPDSPRQVALSIPAGTAAGDLLIASLAVRYNQATVTPPDGWALLRDSQQASGAASCTLGTTAGIRLLTYYKVAVAGEPEAVFDYASTCNDDGFAAAGVVRFTGVDPSNPIVTSAAQTTGSNTTHAAPSVTPGVANTMLLTVHAYGSSRSWNEGYSGVSGMTERVDQRSYGADNGLGTTLSMYTQSLTATTAAGTRTAQGAGDADNGATHSIVLRPTSADLALTMVRNGALTPGGNASYTLTVSNNGPAASSGTTTVVDTLPAGLSYTGYTGSGWSCSAAGQVVTCTHAGSIANGASSAALVISVSVSAGASGVLTNTATVSGPGLDNASGNNTATDSYEIPLNCFTDNFDRASLGSDWTVNNTGGTFGNARIVGNRLRLTDASGNAATAAHLQRQFPGANNKVIVEFDQYAYSGTGADGIGVIFSNATVSPVAGAYGGSLGYAQRDTPTNGFAGGWLGIGIDEYGNFANATEGRSGGAGFLPDSVTIRGSGSGTSGYAFHRNSGTLSPGIDQSGYATITYVGAGGAATATSGNVSPALPAGIAAGDLLLCQVVSRDNVAHAISGWTQRYSTTHGSDLRASLFWKFAVASESAPTVSHTGGSGIQARCTAFRSVDANTPFDVNDASATVSNDDKIDTGGLTPVTNGAMILIAGYIQDNAGADNGIAADQGLTWTQDYFAQYNPSGGANDNAIAFFHARQATAGALSGFQVDTGNNANSIGVLSALRPAATNATAHRYRVTVDHSDGSHAYVKVERDTGSGYATIIAQYDAKAESGQATVPTNWALSFTGSTGGSTNIHEIDNLSVCTIQPIVSSGLHHVRLDHTGSGVTCAGSSVTVHACDSADSSGSCTANTNGLTGNVIAKSSGGVILATVPFTIAAGSSSTTVTVPVTSAQTVSFETSGLSITPSSSPAWTCWTGSATCSHVYSDAGFIFSSVANGTATDIANQVAGVGSGTYYLRAVKTNSTTKACEAALAGTQTVKFGYECTDPGTCHGANLMSINGGTSTLIARNNEGSVSTFTDVSLTFDANGNAGFTINYTDVGEVRLHASKAAAGSLLTGLIGATNTFIVKPYGFLLSAACADGAANAASQSSPSPADGKFCRAGQDFTATVTAVSLAGTATPSYGRESTPETVAVAWTRHLPSGGDDGALPAGSPSYTANGAFGPRTYTGGWTEVGILKAGISVGDNDYLGAGNVNTAAYLGRFYPDHFDVLVTPQCGTFVYSGRPGATAVPGQAFTVTATAKNVGDGDTKNYAGGTGGFAKPVTLSLPTGGTGVGKLYVGSSEGGANAIPAANFAAGVGTVAHDAASGRISYVLDTFPAVDTAFTVRAADGDTGTPIGSGVTDGTGTARSGRLRLLNAYGSELLPLRVRLQAEYFLGNGRWTLNTADTCTSVPADAVALGNRTPSDIGSSVSSVTAVSGGAWDIVLAKPAKAGSVDLVLNLAGSTAATNACIGSWGNGPTGGGTSAGLEYLASAWCGATYDKIPTARARFGSPRAPFIYLRERY